MLYIDAFNHILPKKYQAVLEQKVPNRDMSSNLSRYAETVPTLLDLDARFRLMDSVEGYMQVLTLAAPTVESVASPEVAVDLCRFANDEMAELVEKYPDRFAAAIAAVEAEGVSVDVVLLDGNPLHLDPREVNVVKGDGKCASIAAASLVAKVARDHVMEAYAEQYPGYGFESNKGYGSEGHMAAIRERGLCPIHRRSFCSFAAQESLF